MHCGRRNRLLGNTEAASYIRDAEGNYVDTYYFSFTIVQGPAVVSTNPPNGATYVSAYLTAISITFSKAMDTSRCGAETNWPYQQGGSCTWSADKRTMTLTRNTQPVSGRIVVYLNLPGTDPLIRDTDGFYLWAYSFEFTISTASAQMSKIPADPAKGFQWPYYLYVPAALKYPTVLLVEPNNSGHPTNDPAEDDSLASQLISLLSKIGKDQ